MELIKESVSIGKALCSDSFEVMSEGDLIVPDTKPDILKVLQVEAYSCITSKEISGGRLTINGKVDLTILYLPDCDNSCLESMRTSFDFSHRVENPDIYEGCYTLAESDVSKVDFHIINSRKISLRALTGINCEIICPCEISFLEQIEKPQVQTRNEPLTINSLCGVRCEDFIIKDCIEIPSGKAEISEVLKVDYKISDKEFKPITEKVVVKGTLSVCILYRDPSGDIEYTEAQIPFTEVFDFPDIDESMCLELGFCINDFFYDVTEDTDGDKRIINLELMASAEMKAQKNREMTVICDCFCPGYESDISTKEVCIDEIISAPKSQFSLRDIAVADDDAPKIGGVYNVISSATVTNSYAEDGKVSVEGKIIACILYLADNSHTPIYSFKKEIPFSYMLDAPNAKQGMDLGVNAEIAHTSFHLNAANEVELRFILNISANVLHKRCFSIIDDICLAEIPKDKKKGIVIYFVQPGDSLWSIAKNYSVAVEDIVTFNKLEKKDCILPGMRLIIPATCKKEG